MNLRESQRLKFEGLQKGVEKFTFHSQADTTEGDDLEALEDDEEELDEQESKLKEKSKTNCMRILRFLQLLCENHHAKLQNYLHEQKNDGAVNGKTFDFVSYVSLIFGVYEKSYINVSSCGLGH